MLEEPTPLRIDDPGVRALFTDAARFPSWLDVEAALTGEHRVMARSGSGMISAAFNQHAAGRLGGTMESEPAQFADRLVSGMSDAIIYADAEGVIRLWNRGATRIFGFAEAEALGRSLDIIIPEPLRERHWQGFRATMRTGESRYGDGQVLSAPAVRKDGARISVEFTIVPFTNDSGQMIGIAAIMRDTTTRFEELRALRRQLAVHLAATGAESKNSQP
jgi:PAS domain S-box-containing protein